MTTTRAQFATAFVAGVQGRQSPDAIQTVIAWQMAEGQTAGENDPLASLRPSSAAPGAGGAGDRFSFASIDLALATSVAQCSPGHVYQSIGDAFRAGKPADQLITAIGLAGWCGGPRMPCPGYAASIRANYNRLADANTYAREAAVLVGSSTISGAAGATGTPGPSAPIAQPVSLSPGDLLGLGGAVLGGGVTSAAGAVEAFGSLAAHLVSPAWWKRVGVFVLGLGIAGYGLSMLTRDMAPGVHDAIAGKVKLAGKLPDVVTTAAAL